MANRKKKRCRQPDARPSCKFRLQVKGAVLAPTRRVHGKCKPRAAHNRHLRLDVAAANRLRALLREAQSKAAQLQNEGVKKDALIATLRLQVQTLAAEAETCNRMRLSATCRAEDQVKQIRSDLRSVCCSSCWDKWTKLMERYK